MLSKERGLDEFYQSELVLIILSLPLVSVEPLATSLVCVLRILRLSLRDGQGRDPPANDLLPRLWLCASVVGTQV